MHWVPTISVQDLSIGTKLSFPSLQNKQHIQWQFLPQYFSCMYMDVSSLWFSTTPLSPLRALPVFSGRLSSKARQPAPERMPTSRGSVEGTWRHAASGPDFGRSNEWKRFVATERFFHPVTWTCHETLQDFHGRVGIWKPIHEWLILWW